MKKHLNGLLGAMGLSLLALSIAGGCRCAPAEPAGFVPTKLMQPSPEDTAFRREWRASDFPWAQYHKIYVTPVRTDIKLPTTAFENGVDLTGESSQDFKDYCYYVRTSLQQAIAKNGRFKLASGPGADTLTVELALVKVVPGKPIYHGCMLIVPFPISTAIDIGLNALTHDAFSSSCAMECRIVDHRGNSLVMGLADNEQAKTAILNILDLTLYGNQRQIADEWSAAIAAKLSRPNARVPAPEPFVLINY